MFIYCNFTYLQRYYKHVFHLQLNNVIVSYFIRKIRVSNNCTLESGRESSQILNAKSGAFYCFQIQLQYVLIWTRTLMPKIMIVSDIMASGSALRFTQRMKSSML